MLLHQLYTETILYNSTNLIKKSYVHINYLFNSSFSRYSLIVAFYKFNDRKYPNYRFVMRIKLVCLHNESKKL